MNAAILRAPRRSRSGRARTGRVSKSARPRRHRDVVVVKFALSMGFAPLAVAQAWTVATDTRAIALTDVLCPARFQADRRVRAAPEGDPRPGRGLDPIPAASAPSATWRPRRASSWTRRTRCRDRRGHRRHPRGLRPGRHPLCLRSRLSIPLNAKSTKIKTGAAVEEPARLEGTSWRISPGTTSLAPSSSSTPRPCVPVQPRRT